MEEILKKISKYNNFKDITTYTEQIIEDYRKNNTKPKLSQAFEAMNLYNMYIDAMDGKNCEEYLYPFKLRKVIEIANAFTNDPCFVINKGSYVFRGEISIDELDSVLNVLIKYANVNLILKIIKAFLPLASSLPILESIYVALGIMKYKKMDLPIKVGQYYTMDYISKCSEMPFYQSARQALKKIISLSQLPRKAASMYFTLPELYNALCEAGIFDFGIIATQCFKIIEISAHEILNKIFTGMQNEDVYELLPDNLKEAYTKDRFNLGYLEIGKIYHLLNDSKNEKNDLYNKIISFFKDEEILDLYLSYFTPAYISKYRNAPAHGEYVTQEVADEAVKLLDSFINTALYRINQS